MHTNLYDAPDPLTLRLLANNPWNFLFAYTCGQRSTRERLQAQWERTRGWQLDFTTLQEFELQISHRCVCKEPAVPVHILEQSSTEMKAKKMMVKVQIDPFQYQQGCACASRTRRIVEDIFRRACH